MPIIDYIKGLLLISFCILMFIPLSVVAWMNRRKREKICNVSAKKLIEDEEEENMDFDELCNDMTQKKYVSDGNEDDLLDRHQTINHICDIVDESIKSKKYTTLALNGQWGSGKTFILQKVKEQIQNKYLIFEYDCWKNDFYDEPLYGIVYSIATSLNEVERDNPDFAQDKYYRAMRKIFFSIANVVSKGLLNFDLKEIKEDASEIIKTAKEEKIEMTVDGFCTDLHDVLDKINTLLTNYLSYEGKKIVFLVDELDRCLPDYAIKVLNRLHHICNGTSIVLVLSINKQELYPNVSIAFGREANDDLFARNYLRRFTDVEIDLNKGYATNLLPLWDNFLQQFNNSVSLDFFSRLTRNVLSELPMREIKKAINQIMRGHNIAYSSVNCTTSLSLAIVCAETIIYVSKVHHNKDSIDFVYGPFQSGPVDENDLDENGFPEFRQNTFSINDCKKKFGFCVDDLISEYDQNVTPCEILLNCDENRVKALFTEETFPTECNIRQLFVCNSSDPVYKFEKNVLSEFAKKIGYRVSFF